MTISDLVWGAAATIASAVSGLLMYERKKIDDRITKLENELSDHKTAIAVIKSSFLDLKEDIQEIKEVQKAILDLLSKRR